MASSSSNFPLSPKMKLTKKPNNSSSSMAIRLHKRQKTLFKKAYELQTLCGIEVCVICYTPDGGFQTWPEDSEIVKNMARRYIVLSETKRRKKRVELQGFLVKKKARLGSFSKYPDWDPRFDSYSVEQLTELMRSLELHLIRFQQRARVVAEAQTQRMMQSMTVADQEQSLVMTIPTMDHLQQQPNHVSMNLFNTSMQFQASSSAVNPVQSLAPFPSQLQIYPNYYPEFLGEQVNTFNGFHNGSMSVEEYLMLLGVQATDGNGFQNMNMWGY